MVELAATLRISSTETCMPRICSWLSRTAGTGISSQNNQSAGITFKSHVKDLSQR
jgi:hypothetical protein